MEIVYCDGNNRNPPFFQTLEQNFYLLRMMYKTDRNLGPKEVLISLLGSGFSEPFPWACFSISLNLRHMLLGACVSLERLSLGHQNTGKQIWWMDSRLWELWEVLTLWAGKIFFLHGGNYSISWILSLLYKFHIHLNLHKCSIKRSYSIVHTLKC